MSSNSLTTPDQSDQLLVDILESSTAAAEKFVADNAAIDYAHLSDTIDNTPTNDSLREIIREKLSDYRSDARDRGRDGEDATSGGSGLGGEALVESPAGP